MVPLLGSTDFGEIAHPARGMYMTDKYPDFSLSAAELQILQNHASEQMQAFVNEDSAMSYTLNVTFSYCVFGRTVTCNVSGGPPVVISDDVGL
ncbi:hypothetical protein [Diaphorobacter caeni]|uniref:hypothetical protein n=1 Tax=Diaphorobacter caeni TaxID=2784387 RepID=UPI00188E1B8C|nr:hypothetical protein [Diaphorobacter caeni]MBF5003803.1 hypothetical protein [Diaphorobacter caeni]